jgi:non-lysosomal glucosylceramidase
VTWPDDLRAAECDGAEFGHLVMPVGGIGTGNLAISADGGLRQWQLHNIGNHEGAVPGSFFALRVSRWEPPLDEVRILQAPPRDSTGTPLVTDDVVPDWQRDLLSRHPGVARTTFSGTYPVARVRYLDPALPLDVTLETFNPLVPLDVDASSIPAAMFTFRLVNTDGYPLHGTLGATAQNAVGWDGITPIDGVDTAGYGGNTNRLLRRDGWTSIVLENAALPDDAPGAGQDHDAVAHLAAQLATVRSPTCFRVADGRFFAFEGVLGASTAMWSGRYGGSCPLNCTHVWNYAQALAAAFPELERNMRETEFEIMQAQAGYIPHRVITPTYLQQLWDQPIGGPEQPALDGMLGAVLKAYREYRAGAGIDWLRRFWPNLTRLLHHIDRTWSVDGTGMLSGIQPSTHDIHLTGHNPFMGTLWLATLRAAETMALLVQDADAAAAYRDTFRQASESYDAALFTGEYYVQRLRPDDNPHRQWGAGCLTDQLIGQWWAHQLDLGYLLPAKHVRTALAAVVRYNLRRGFRDFTHPYRVFADGDDAGLLMCTWPHGGRPEVPTRYADEVWTGSEYQVAAHCRREGLYREGRAVLDAVWARYDGRRRNPFNEIECGDHYARSLAGWSVLPALAGFTHDGPAGAFSFCQPDTSVPFLASSGWGLWSQEGDELVMTCTGGRLDLHRLSVVGGLDEAADECPAEYEASVDGTAVSVRCTDGGIEFRDGISLNAGQTLTLTSRTPRVVLTTG